MAVMITCFRKTCHLAGLINSLSNAVAAPRERAQIRHTTVTEQKSTGVSETERSSCYLAGLINRKAKLWVSPGSVPKFDIVPLLNRKAWVVLNVPRPNHLSLGRTG